MKNERLMKANMYRNSVIGATIKRNVTVKIFRSPPKSDATLKIPYGTLFNSLFFEEREKLIFINKFLKPSPL